MAQCNHCNEPFEPKSKVNIYCSRQCQLDHRNQRPVEETIRRQETGFAWEPIRPAAPVNVKAPKQRNLKHFNVVQGWETALVIPDQQFGYRYYPDGTLDPFHDPRAIEIVEKIAEIE